MQANDPTTAYDESDVFAAWHEQEKDGWCEDLTNELITQTPGEACERADNYPVEQWLEEAIWLRCDCIGPVQDYIAALLRHRCNPTGDQREALDGAEVALVNALAADAREFAGQADGECDPANIVFQADKAQHDQDAAEYRAEQIAENRAYRAENAMDMGMDVPS